MVKARGSAIEFSLWWIQSPFLGDDAEEGTGYATQGGGWRHMRALGNESCRLQRTYRPRCHSIRPVPPQFLSQTICDVTQ